MAQTQSSANLKLINTVFAAMLVSMVGYFIYWGLGYTHYNHSGLFILATFSASSWRLMWVVTILPTLSVQVSAPAH